MAAVMRVVSMETLREARKRRKMSREKLAFRTGGRISAQTIYAIEVARQVPRQITRELIAEALDVGMDEIAWPEEVRSDLSNPGESELESETDD